MEAVVDRRWDVHCMYVGRAAFAIVVTCFSSLALGLGLTNAKRAIRELEFDLLLLASFHLSLSKSYRRS